MKWKDLWGIDWDRQELDWTYIYAITCNDFVKVGIARDPMQRLDGFRTGNPYPVELHAAFRVPYRRAAELVEALVHKELAIYCVQREWFAVAPNKAVIAMCNCLQAFCDTHKFPEHVGFDDTTVVLHPKGVLNVQTI